MKNLKAETCKCKGCVVVDGCDAFQMDSFYVYGCPCRTCLVKMICEDNCTPYNKFNRKIYGDKSFIKNMTTYKRPMRIADKHNLLRKTA